MGNYKRDRIETVKSRTKGRGNSRMVLCFIITRVKKLLIFKDENCRQPIAKTREQQISLIARDLDGKSFLSFEQQF